MGVIRRQSIKTTVISYIGVLAGIVNILYLYPKFLKPEEIGLIRTLTDLCILFAPFAQLGIASVIIRFSPHFSNSLEKRKEFSTLFVLIPLIGFGLLVSCYFLFKEPFLNQFRENSELLVVYSTLLIPLSFITIFHNVFEAYSRSLLRVVVPKFIKDVLIRVLTTLLVVAYAYLSFKLETFLYLYVLIFLIGLVVLVVYTQKLQVLKFTTRFVNISQSFFREIMVYSLFVLFGGVGGAIVARIDILMLSSLIGLTESGIYTISLFMGNAIEIPRRAISQIAMPVISKAIKDENYEDIASLYKKSALNQLIVGGFLLIGLWASIDHLFDIMPKGGLYQEGKYVVLFIGLAKLFDMAMGVNNEIIVMSRYYRYNIFLMIFFVMVAVGLNYMMIPLYGIEGAAMATFLSIIVYNIARFILVYFAFGIHPFSKQTLKAILIIVVTFSLTLLVPRVMNPVVTIGILSLLISVVYWSLTLGFGISDDLNKIARQVYNTVLARFNK